MFRVPCDLRARARLVRACRPVPADRDACHSVSFLPPPSINTGVPLNSQRKRFSSLLSSRVEERFPRARGGGAASAADTPPASRATRRILLRYPRERHHLEYRPREEHRDEASIRIAPAPGALGQARDDDLKLCPVGRIALNSTLPRRETLDARRRAPPTCAEQGAPPRRESSTSRSEWHSAR